MTAAAGPSPFSPPTGTMPGYDGVEIASNGTTNLDSAIRALFIGVGGTVVLQTLKGTSLTFTNVQSGAILPVQAIKIYSTSSGTTATGLIGIF